MLLSLSCLQTVAPRLRVPKGSASCVAPPGWAQAAAGANITVCPLNTYKAGWSNEPCASCGTNVFTNATGSVAKENCLVPPAIWLGSVFTHSCGKEVSDSLGVTAAVSA